MTVVEELTTARRLALEAVQVDSEGDRPEDALKLYAACTQVIAEVTDRRDIALSEEIARELHNALRQYAERSEQLRLRLVREGKAFGLLDGLLVDCCGNTLNTLGSSSTRRGVVQQTERRPHKASGILSFTVITASELDSLKSPSQWCHENQSQENNLPEDTPPPTVTAAAAYQKPPYQYDPCASQCSGGAKGDVTGGQSPENPLDALSEVPQAPLRCGQCGGWIGNGEYCVAPRPFGGAPVALHRTCFYLFAAGLARERRNRFTFGNGEVVVRTAIAQRAVQRGTLLTVRVEVGNASHARITAITLWMETREKRAHHRAWSHRTASVKTQLAGKLPSKESRIEGFVPYEIPRDIQPSHANDALFSRTHFLWVKVHIGGLHIGVKARFELVVGTD